MSGFLVAYDRVYLSVSSSCRTGSIRLSLRAVPIFLFLFFPLSLTPPTGTATPSRIVISIFNWIRKHLFRRPMIALYVSVIGTTINRQNTKVQRRLQRQFLYRTCVSRIIQNTPYRYFQIEAIDQKEIKLGPNKLYSILLLYNSYVDIGGGIEKGIVGVKNEHPIDSSYTSFYQ